MVLSRRFQSGGWTRLTSVEGLKRPRVRFPRSPHIERFLQCRRSKISRPIIVRLGLVSEARGPRAQQRESELVLAGEGDYLVGLGYVGGYGFGEVGVELGGVFLGEEGGDGLLGLVEGGAFGVDGGGAVHQVLKILFP